MSNQSCFNSEFLLEKSYLSISQARPYSALFQVKYENLLYQSALVSSLATVLRSIRAAT
jgi:hypothetical protein